MAPLRLQHCRNDRADKQEGAVDVDRENAPPQSVAHLVSRGEVIGDTGNVGEPIDACARDGEDPLDSCGLGDVHGDRLHSGRLGGEGFQAIHRNVDSDDTAALSHDPACNGSSDSGRGAGHDHRADVEASRDDPLSPTNSTHSGHRDDPVVGSGDEVVDHVLIELPLAEGDEWAERQQADPCECGLVDSRVGEHRLDERTTVRVSHPRTDRGIRGQRFRRDHYGRVHEF